MVNEGDMIKDGRALSYSGEGLVEYVKSGKLEEEADGDGRVQERVRGSL